VFLVAAATPPSSYLWVLLNVLRVGTAAGSTNPASSGNLSRLNTLASLVPARAHLAARNWHFEVASIMHTLVRMQTADRAWVLYAGIVTVGSMALAGTREADWRQQTFQIAASAPAGIVASHGRRS
jgi:hypothetical protein